MILERDGVKMSDLQEILSRDPRGFTKTGPEIRKIIEILRASRHQYNLGNAKAGSTKPPKPKSEAGKLDLGPLDL